MIELEQINPLAFRKTGGYLTSALVKEMDFTVHRILVNGRSTGYQIRKGQVTVIPSPSTLDDYLDRWARSYILQRAQKEGTIQP